MTASPQVVAVHRSGTHSFSKYAEDRIILLAGRGVAGDAHAGPTVQHRSRLARCAGEANVRQVHLIQSELFDELVEAGFPVWAGELGENVTTRGIDLLALPAGTRLRLGAGAVIELTGLRTPCVLIDRFQGGLAKAVTTRDAQGRPVLRGGVMAIVVEGGEVRPRDAVAVRLPDGEPRPLAPV